MTDTKDRLKKSVGELANFLRGQTPKKDYFGEDGKGTKAAVLIASALEVKYSVKASGKLADFELIVSYGGPNVWCDSKTVYGAWGDDRIEVGYKDGIGLFQAVESQHRAAQD